MLAGELAPAPYHRWRHAAPDVLLERLRPLDLAAIARDHAWPRRQSRERLVEQLVAMEVSERVGIDRHSRGLHAPERIGANRGRAGVRAHPRTDARVGA